MQLRIQRSWEFAKERKLNHDNSYKKSVSFKIISSVAYSVTDHWTCLHGISITQWNQKQCLMEIYGEYLWNRNVCAVMTVYESRELWILIRRDMFTRVFFERELSLLLAHTHKYNVRESNLNQYFFDRKCTCTEVHGRTVEPCGLKFFFLKYSQKRRMIHEKKQNDYNINRIFCQSRFTVVVV